MTWTLKIASYAAVVVSAKAYPFTMPGVVHQMVESLSREGRLQRCLYLPRECLEALDIGHVELESNRRAAHGEDFVDQRLGLLGAVTVGNDQVATLLGDAEGGIATQATAGAGHEGDL